jgi:hypothetical protein
LFELYRNKYEPNRYTCELDVQAIMMLLETIEQRGDPSG